MLNSPLTIHSNLQETTNLTLANVIHLRDILVPLFSSCIHDIDNTTCQLITTTSIQLMVNFLIVHNNTLIGEMASLTRKRNLQAKKYLSKVR